MKTTYFVLFSSVNMAQNPKKFPPEISLARVTVLRNCYLSPGIKRVQFTVNINKIKSKNILKWIFLLKLNYFNSLFLYTKWLMSIIVIFRKLSNIKWIMYITQSILYYDFSFKYIYICMLSVIYIFFIIPNIISFKI